MEWCRELTVVEFLQGETALQSATSPAILRNIILKTFGKCLIVCGELRELVGWYWSFKAHADKRRCVLFSPIELYCSSIQSYDRIEGNEALFLMLQEWKRMEMNFQFAHVTLMAVLTTPLDCSEVAFGDPACFVYDVVYLGLFSLFILAPCPYHWYDATHSAKDGSWSCRGGTPIWSWPSLASEGITFWKHPSEVRDGQDPDRCAILSSSPFVLRMKWIFPAVPFFLAIKPWFRDSWRHSINL